jgi:hypothetical protein
MSVYFLGLGLIITFVGFVLDVLFNVRWLTRFFEFVDSIVYAGPFRFVGLGLVTAIAMYGLGALVLGPVIGFHDAFIDVYASCGALSVIIIVASIFGGIHDTRAAIGSYVSKRRPQATRSAWGVLGIAAFAGTIAGFIITHI